MSINLNEFRKLKLYKQSGAAIGSAIVLPFAAIVKGIEYEKGLTTYYPDDLLYISPDYQFYHYFSKEKCRPIANELFRRMEQHSTWIEVRVKRTQEALMGFEEVGEKLLAVVEDYPHSKERIRSALKEFLEKDLAYWIPSIFIDVFDPFESEVLDFIFGEKRKKIGANDMQILLTPRRSIIWEERQAFKKIREAAKQNKWKGNHPLLVKMAERHAQDYYWIQNDFQTVKRLTASDFLQRLGEKEELLDLEKVASQKEELIKKYGLDMGVVNRLHQFGEMTYLRDLRKKYSQIASYYTVTFLHSLSKKMGIPSHWSDFLVTFAEYNQFLDKDPALLKELQLRTKIGVAIAARLGGNSPGIETQHARELFDLVESHLVGGSILYGNVASVGKGIGPVKIVLRQSDFGKFNEGDVLITGMTRPEFVPLMKRAVAIVTDEGGITCHAAIVSRELGKPCIIGTQTSTKAFRDGEIVEVNANHGFIRKVEESDEK